MTLLELNCLSYNSKGLETVSSAILLKQTVNRVAIRPRLLCWWKEVFAFSLQLIQQRERKAMNQIIALKQTPGDPEVPVIYHETLLLLQHNHKGAIVPTLTRKP